MLLLDINKYKNKNININKNIKIQKIRIIIKF